MEVERHGVKGWDILPPPPLSRIKYSDTLLVYSIRSLGKLCPFTGHPRSRLDGGKGGTCTLGGSLRRSNYDLPFDGRVESPRLCLLYWIQYHSQRLSLSNLKLRTQTFAKSTLPNVCESWETGVKFLGTLPLLLSWIEHPIHIPTLMRHVYCPNRVRNMNLTLDHSGGGGSSSDSSTNDNNNNNNPLSLSLSPSLSGRQYIVQSPVPSWVRTGGWGVRDKKGEGCGGVTGITQEEPVGV